MIREHAHSVLVLLALAAGALGCTDVVVDAGDESVAEIQEPVIGAPASGVYIGHYVDRDWSWSNLSGDKNTSEGEWDDSDSRFAGKRPKFKKIFPEWFNGNGSWQYYSSWSDEVERIKAQGSLPYINWEAHGDTNNGQPTPSGTRIPHPDAGHILNEINNGLHDGLINDVAVGLRNSGVEVMLDLFHEMNGSWYAWSPCYTNGGSASWADFRNAFRRVVQKFRDAGAHNVTFVQTVWFENYSGCTPPFSEIHATGTDSTGRQYAEWLGIDIYNGGNREFNTLADPFYWQMNTLGKPMYIGEMGTVDDGTKAAWINNWKNWMSGTFTQFRGFNWFDINKAWIGGSEKNWRIDAANGRDAFMTAMNDSRFQGTNGSSSACTPGNTVALRAKANDNFVAAEASTAGVPVRARSGSVGGWEKFEIVDAGSGWVGLKAKANNKYLSANLNLADKPLVADWATGIGGWEKFQFVSAGNGFYGIKSGANNLYVSSNLNHNNALEAGWATTIGGWEQFACTP
jgi:hypothetical protein